MSKLLGKAVISHTTDVPLNTAVEAVVMVSPRVPVRVATCLVHIRAWVQWLPAVGATNVVGRIYRGAVIQGSGVGEANTVARTGGDGSTEVFMVEAVDLRGNIESAQYALSLEQLGGAGAGSFIYGVVEVEVLSG